MVASATSAFAVALSLAPDHPRAAAWRKEKVRLGRWWRAEAYVFQRGADGTLIRSPGLPAASNMLGGGQEAGLIAVTPNPFGRVRVELQARYAVPENGFSKPDPGRGQAAIGIAVRPLRKVPITLVAERLIKLGSLARNDFQFRAYGGTSRRVRGVDISLFGEAGVVGKRPDSFAGAQLLVEKPIRLPGDLDLGLGVGAWGAMQRSDHMVDRLDIGPTLRISHPSLRSSCASIIARTSPAMRARAAASRLRSQAATDPNESRASGGSRALAAGAPRAGAAGGRTRPRA